MKKSDENDKKKNSSGNLIVKSVNDQMDENGFVIKVIFSSFNLLRKKYIQKNLVYALIVQ